MKKIHWIISPSKRDQLGEISKFIFSEMDLRPSTSSQTARPQASHILSPHGILDMLSPPPRKLFFLFAWWNGIHFYFKKCSWFFRLRVPLLKALLAVYISPYHAYHHYTLHNSVCNYLLNISTQIRTPMTIFLIMSTAIPGLFTSASLLSNRAGSQ